MNRSLWCSLATLLFHANATAAEQPVNLLEAGDAADLTMVVSDAADPLEEFAASELAAYLKKTTGIKPQLVRAQNAAKQTLMRNSNLIVLGQVEENSLLTHLAREGFFKPHEEQQGYCLRADANPLDPDGKSWGAVICGTDPLGVLYAVRDFMHFPL